MPIQFMNNAVSSLSLAITGGQTSITVPAGEGARFPAPVAGDYFVITVQETTAFEIMHCTNRIGDSLSVTRARENTLPQNFAAGSSVTARITAGSMEKLRDDTTAAKAAADAAQVTANAAVKKAGDTMTGALALSYASPKLSLHKTLSGQSNEILGYLVSSPRWGVVLGDATAESGTKTGSDFVIQRYLNAGGLIDSPLNINRDTGKTQTLALEAKGTVSAIGSGVGFTVMNPSASSGVPGLVSFHTGDGTRTAYIGSKDPSSSRNLLVAEAGWTWSIVGETYHSNVARFDNVVCLRTNTDYQILSFRVATTDVERGLVFHQISTGAMGIQVKDATGANGQQIMLYNNAGGGTFRPPVVNVSPNPGDNYAPLELMGASGADGSVVGMTFHVPGKSSVKLALRSDHAFGVTGGTVSVAWPWYVNIATGNMYLTGAYNTTSDARLKEAIQTIPDALSLVGAMRGVTFTWNAASGSVVGKPGVRDTGLVAQDLEPLAAWIPGAVSESEVHSLDGTPIKTIAYDKLVPVLVEALKALDARVKQLETQGGGNVAR